MLARSQHGCRIVKKKVAQYSSRDWLKDRKIYESTVRRNRGYGDKFIFLSKTSWTNFTRNWLFDHHRHLITHIGSLTRLTPLWIYATDSLLSPLCLSVPLWSGRVSSCSSLTWKASETGFHMGKAAILFSPGIRTQSQKFWYAVYSLFVQLPFNRKFLSTHGKQQTKIGCNKQTIE